MIFSTCCSSSRKADGRLPWPFEAQVVLFYHNYRWGELTFDGGEPRDFCLKTYPRPRSELLAQVPRPAALRPIGLSLTAARRG